MKTPTLKINARYILLKLAKLRFLAITLLILIVFGFATLRITNIFSVTADLSTVEAGTSKIKADAVKLDTDLIEIIQSKNDVDVIVAPADEHIDNPFRYNVEDDE